MPILTFTFPGGRYHATPWGAHVNEAQVEWPPSPWRVCRALLATGMTKLGWSETELPPTAIELFDRLGAALPDYQLPEPLTVAHTRHYMPIPGNTTKVFDGFAHVGDQPLRMSWAIDLSPPAYALFEQLVARMSYLGRAESWTEASLTVGALERPNCRPCTGPELDDAHEPVTLLAPMAPADYQAWRAAQLAARPELAVAGRGRRGKAKSAASLIPDDLLAALLRSTDDLQRQGWNTPPGSRRVLYARPCDALVTAQPTRAPRLRVAREPVECALLALTSYAVRGEVLPPVARAVPQMEHLHRALARLLDGHSCPEITGRGDDHSPRQDGHRHAHYIPLSLRPRLDPAARIGDLALDHILIHAPSGLGDRAQLVLGRLAWIHTATVGERSDDGRDERSRLTTTLVATGDRELIHDTLVAHSAHHDILGCATTWRSHTPFIAPRFVKARHPLEEQVRAELRSRGLPDPSRIDIEPHDAAVDAGFLRFVRARRRDRPQPPTTRPWSLRIEFSEPIRGPLALGYGSHFGLGLFRPTSD